MSLDEDSRFDSFDQLILFARRDHLRKEDELN